MTTYTNTNTNPTENGWKHHEPIDDHKQNLIYLCLDCFRLSEDRSEFSELIQRMKPIFQWKSKTPHLDAAYVEGVADLLSLLKDETRRRP